VPDVEPKGAAAGALPPAVAAILRGSGLPTKSFAFDVRAVDGIDASPLVAFHAEQPFLLASTTKVVTSLAALDLLGPRHRWRTSAYATGPVVGGRLAGDLVIVGGPVGLTGNELRRWFRQMRAEGPGDNRRQHRPRRRRAAARARAEAGARDRAGARARGAHRRAHLQPRQAARLGEAGRGRPRRRDGQAAAGQRPGRQRRAHGRRLQRLGALEDARRDRVRPAAAAVGARPLERECGADDIAYVAPPPKLRLEPELGSARRCRSPRRAWSPTSGPRPAARCAAMSSSATSPRAAARRLAGRASC
jgi:hypothetical protein